jgi:NAD(P)-dependent dehydrogenase (short-subunit alcohol dehydrogenase family)
MTYSKLLAGKRIFVTGASRGLGRAVCRVFAGRGARVAFSYSKDGEGAAETLREIEQQGAPGLMYKASVLDASAMAGIAEELDSRWGGTDILVNNAGISSPLPIALMEEDDWDRVVDVNAKGTYLASRAFVRGMIRRKAGCILNISSLAGMRVIEAPVHYSASKAAVKGLTESLSKEVGRYNVRVICLAPGLLEGGVGDNLPEHRLRDFLRHVALHRKGTYEEIAKCASFIVSDANSYMNGATIIIDGGF